MKQPLQVGLALALHLLLIIAAVQAWMIGWPGKVWLTIGALFAVAASVLLFRRFRGSPLIVGCIAVAALFMWPAFRFGSGAGGLMIGGAPFGTASASLIVVALLIAATQLWRLASSPRIPRWIRFIPAALALYAIVLIVLGIARGASAAEPLSLRGPLPWWLSGPYLGSAILLPIGVVVALTVFAVAVGRRRDGALSAFAILVVMLSAFAVSGMELTRNGRPNVAQFLVPASLAGASTGAYGREAESVSGLPSLTAGLGAGDENLAPFDGKDLDEIFARVATGVRYEPYAGILRGAIGTAIARSGNSADQSMLLAELLRRAGYKVRFARGAIADTNIVALIRGMYPPRIADLQLASDYSPYDPVSDTALREIVRDHVWVEVFQGQGWLPLDPSFPRAKIGESYGASTQQSDAPADDLYHVIEAVVREETVGGQTRELARFSGRVFDLALKPISLVARAIPQAAADESAGKSIGGPGAVVGGMGGALGGSPEQPKETPKPVSAKKQIIGVAYVRTLMVGDDPKKIARTAVLNANPQTKIRREWIELNLRGPRVRPRRVERVLYQLDEKNNQPADERRYTISIVGGRVSAGFASQQTRLAGTLVDPAAIQKQAGSFAGISPDDSRAKSIAAKLMRLDNAAGTVAGHLLALRFAAESDSISRLVADGSGVSLVWSTPRIIISGVESTTTGSDRTDAKVSLDLRLDEVTSYPYPGAPSRLAQIFQAARGLQESVVEGGVLEVLGRQDDAVNTASLMEAAYAADVPLVVINASTRSTMSNLSSPPKNCLEMIEAALAKGHEIIIPMKAVTLAGVPRWGWWEVDPASNSMIGVMESGEHQGMVEYSVNADRIGLNDETGRAVGSLVGSITTVGTLSAGLLKYGAVTPQLIAEVKAQVKAIMCFMCFDKARVTAGRKITFSIGDECFKRDFKAQVGAEFKVGFCDSYIKGFKCASSILFAALEGKPFDKATYAVGASVDMGCDKYDARKKFGT